MGIRRFFYGAPGRAHLLGGASPLLTRQGEDLAERQGCRGRLRIWRKPKAKRWPDEQEADTRRGSRVRCPLSLKPNTCTESCDVDPTGISVKVSAQYPGRSACVPCATGVERRRDAHTEVSRGHSRLGQGGELKRTRPKTRTWNNAIRTFDLDANR